MRLCDDDERRSDPTTTSDGAATTTRRGEKEGEMNGRKMNEEEKQYGKVQHSGTAIQQFVNDVWRDRTW